MQNFNYAQFAYEVILEAATDPLKRLGPGRATIVKRPKSRMFADTISSRVVKSRDSLPNNVLTLNKKINDKGLGNPAHPRVKSTSREISTIRHGENSSLGKKIMGKARKKGLTTDYDGRQAQYKKAFQSHKDRQYRQALDKRRQEEVNRMRPRIYQTMFQVKK